MSIMERQRSKNDGVKRRKLHHDSTENAGDSSASASSEVDAENPKSEHDMKTAVQSRPQQSSHPASRSISGPVKPTVNGQVMLSSNTLQAKMKSLISEVRVDHEKALKKSRPTTDQLVDIIDSMEATERMSYLQAEIFAKKTLHISIPWSTKPAADIKYSFEFRPPASIDIRGTLAQCLSIKGDSRILIVPQMPLDLFQDKDYLNHRALHKRAFYLACIASSVQATTGADFEIDFGLLDDNEYIPVLNVHEKKDHRRIYTICPGFPESLGPRGKVFPYQNCLRKDDVLEVAGRTTSSSHAYNSTIRTLATFNSIHQLLADSAQRTEHFREACYLGTVWLQRRGLSSSKSHGGFGVEEWSFATALLLESGGHQGRALFSPKYSAVQLFKAMLQVLSGRDMYTPFTLRGELEMEAAEIPIFYDAVTGVNILYKMTPWSYAKLKQYAGDSLASINSKTYRDFAATFVTKVSETALHYDETFTLDLLEPKFDPEELGSRIYDVLKTGLGDRVSLLNIQSPESQSWKITSSHSVSRNVVLTIGLSINAATTGRLVDHGPSVEDKVATEEFRKFWGQKAELRRFKDGRINESLVWLSETSVTQQIVQYLVAKHFTSQASFVKASADLPRIEIPSSVPAEEAFATVNARLQTLSSTLHHLDGLPLPVRSVSAASALTRSASRNAPFEGGASQPIDVVVQFDTSGRWPDDLRAVQYTKIAFLTKVGDLLTEKDRTLQCRVGLENTSMSAIGTHNNSFLDVVQASSSAALPPLVFRLRIYHDREFHLIQQALSSKTLLTPSLREVYQSALTDLKRTQAAMVHTTTIRTLITSFPPLSATIRLLKQFVSAHLLSAHLPDEIIEILAARVFLYPAPWSVPGTATVAFARCLHFLSQWDWNSEPLIVDLSLLQDMSIQSRQDLETRFIAWRKMDPNLNTVAWFVGTNIDATGVVWSQSRVVGQDPQPPRVIAGRLTALAGAAMQILQNVEQSHHGVTSKLDWKSIFTSSIENFDFVIDLRENVESRNGSKVNGENSKYKNLELANVLEVDTTGVSFAVSYLEDLKHAFGHIAIFLTGDGNGSDKICGLWRPHVAKDGGRRELKIRLGFSTMPLMQHHDDDSDTVSSADCVINKEALLAEMSLLGDGIVRKIGQPKIASV